MSSVKKTSYNVNSIIGKYLIPPSVIKHEHRWFVRAYYGGIEHDPDFKLGEGSTIGYSANIRGVRPSIEDYCLGAKTSVDWKRKRLASSRKHLNRKYTTVTSNTLAKRLYERYKIIPNKHYRAFGRFLNF